MKLGVYTAILHDESLREALEVIGPDMAVNIAHEDVSFGPLEGLRAAAGTVKSADAMLVG